MTDTRKRIKAYKAALPGLRERVTAVALLLAMSMAMMTSATFAWLTISRRPEVSGVSTTLAANGNLEIALVPPDGSEPGESKVGDSSAAEGQTIAKSNLTWGNLINLSDPSYGLDNLTLRPAELQKSDLLSNPLKAMEYSNDGRIVDTIKDFGYTTWNPPTDKLDGYFAPTKGLSADIYGVRAISSMHVSTEGAFKVYKDFYDAIDNANNEAKRIYQEELAGNAEYMNALESMVNIYIKAYIDEKLGSSATDPELGPIEVTNMLGMMRTLISAYEAEYEAMAQTVNLALLLKYKFKEGTFDINFTPWTGDDVKNLIKDKGVSEAIKHLNGLGVTIKNLQQFVTDQTTLENDLAGLQKRVDNGETIYWTASGVGDIVSHLVNTSTCKLNGVQISSLGMSNITDVLDGLKDDGNTVEITNGILKRFEERTGAKLQVHFSSIKIYAKVLFIEYDKTVGADVSTNATAEYWFEDRKRIADSASESDFGGGVKQALDTYAMAIDFWLRTNATGSILTLEGNVLTETDQIPVKGKNASGEEVQIYTIEITVEDTSGDEATTSTKPMNIYPSKADLSEGTVWYKLDDHAEVTAEEMGSQTPKPKMDEVRYVVGYEGENRIWTEDNSLSVDAITQGSGSCYVFYADTPEDQARSLGLLESMKIAFVDAEGKLMASAYMDTQYAHAESGRVIVPLVVDSVNNSLHLGKDDKGDNIYGITRLAQNEATRVTAIVYIDGTTLTNQNVLAASDIQGQLNIQFGTSVALEPKEDIVLADKVLRATASVDKTYFNYDDASEENPMTVEVTVNIEGDQPKSVSAFFMRSISATQGSRENVIDNFKEVEEGVWKGTYTFTKPGNYILRSVTLDGQSHDLSTAGTATLPKVEVEGFTVASVSVAQAQAGHLYVMSAANSTTADVSLTFATSDSSKMPKVVEGRFLNDETQAAVSVPLTYNATTQKWTGKAVFLASGNYTMEFVVLDGEYRKLEDKDIQTANITLGMRVSIYTGEKISFFYVPDIMETEKTDMLDVEMTIIDNADNEKEDLPDVWLYYSMRGASNRTMQAKMTWNGSNYVGTLNAAADGAPGIWQFQKVTVGSGANLNTLNVATASPEFTMIPKDPPKFVSSTNMGTQVVPNGGAYMEVQLAHTDTAAVEARIVNQDGQGAWVKLDRKDPKDENSIKEHATQKNVLNWQFQVPVVNGSQDGNWTMTQLKIYDAYDENGNLYTSEDPMIVNITGNTTKVIQTVNLKFTEDQSYHFGREGGKKDGAVISEFMDNSHSVSGLYVDIVDFEGNPIEEVGNVRMQISYVTFSSESNGGYSGSGFTLDSTTSGATLTIPLNRVGSTSRYAQGDAVPILYAGNYYTTLTFDVGKTPFTYTDDQDAVKNQKYQDLAAITNSPEFSVWSLKPTVTVTGVSPTGTVRVYTMAHPTSGAHITSGEFNEIIDNYTAKVYMYVGEAGTVDTESTIPITPKVNLALTDVPAIKSWTVDIGHATHNEYARTYTFTGNSGEVTIGGGTNGTMNQILGINSSVNTYGTIYPAGVQKIDTISIVYNNGTQDMTFTVGLSHDVTIENPVSPVIASFKVNDSTFTHTISDMLIKGDTVTFDKVEWIATIEEPVGEGTWSAYTNDGEVTDDAGNPVGRIYGFAKWQKTSGFSIFKVTTYYRSYQYFKWTRFVSTYTGEISRYTQKKQVTEWIINGVPYAWDAKIPTSVFHEGTNEVLAVISNVGEPSESVVEPTTAYRVLFGYVAEDKKEDNNVVAAYSGPPEENGGTQYGNTGGSSGNWTSPILADPSTSDANTDTIGKTMTDVQGNYKDFAPLLP